MHFYLFVSQELQRTETALCFSTAPFQHNFACNYLCVPCRCGGGVVIKSFNEMSGLIDRIASFLELVTECRLTFDITTVQKSKYNVN